MTEQQSSQGKNILVFADGTGDEGGLLPDECVSNVYKLYRATRVGPDTAIDPARQVAFYVPGVGTSAPGQGSSLFGRLASGVDQAIGLGVTKRIIECYVGIISVWRPGDRIYLFGFSRGAYTVRCFAHVLEQLGIPTQTSDGKALSLDPKKLFPVAKAGVRILYFMGMTTKDCDERDKRYENFRNVHKCYHGAQIGAIPYFMGVWDTVAAIGLNKFLPNKVEKHLSPEIGYVRHALPIDEYRHDFARVPWGSAHTERPPRPGEPLPFEQVWFAGNHSDVGGSYPENESRLSDITLDWIARFASDQLPQEARVSIDWSLLNLHPSHDGMMHDECMVGIDGSGIPWSKKVRPVDPNGDLHSSVLSRLALPAVRNYDTYGPYRPANLRHHPKAAHFWEGEIGA